MAGITVEVTFMNAELAPENLASDVDAHLMGDGVAVDTALDQFALSLSAAATQYSPDDPIGIQAQLVYDGPEPTIDLSGVFSLVNGFGMEQLDGDLAMGPGWNEPCLNHQLRAGEPLIVPYEKSAGWSQGDPNANFYRDWSADPLLHLPAGTWLVTAYSDFSVGIGCAGERVQMQAAIVITVIESSAPPPSPASTPSATPDPTLTARERIDQYWLGADDLECMGMVPPESIEQQVEWSPLIVVGRPISSAPWSGPDGRWEESWIDFEVSDVLKGSLPAGNTIVVRVQSDGEPKGDISDIDHLLLLWTEEGDASFYLSGGYMSIYANDDGFVVTPEYAAIRQVYGRDHIFSTALDGMSFEALIARVKRAADSEGTRSGQGTTFAC
jgi:hypothetical protein